jgi:flagellar biosynthesis chaperone FliJ
LSPEGEFSAKLHYVPNRLERVLDLSKNVLDKAKRDLGNSLSKADPCFHSLPSVLSLSGG